MPSVKLITPKKTNALELVSSPSSMFRSLACFVLIAIGLPALSQDNSPYTRYGLGDLVPPTNINSRAMGGISAGVNDFLTINYNNPASYGYFQSVREPLSKKMAYGRALLDVGINLDNRTLREPNNIGKFTASNLLFSHVQVGLPIRRNWGLSFGIRPITRISYKIQTTKMLKDPNTGLPIDTSLTINQGDGGSYLASLGTGIKFDLGDLQSIAFGITGGYLFGRKDYSTRISIFNDSLSYNSGNFQTKTTYGNLYASVGFQYMINLDNESEKEKRFWLTVGAYGNWKQTLNASQDFIRETYYFDETSGNVRLDSVVDKKDVKGKIIYPTSYTAGFVLQRFLTPEKGGWLVGVDYSEGKWSDYRFYGQADTSVRDKWELRIGGEITPRPKNNYFSNVSYRAGFFIGEDYIHVKDKLPLLGVSLGMRLPIRNYNRLSPGQDTRINLAFEFIKRGNNNNLLKENMFRLSAGFCLSDFWFAKRKYE
jgi:hypothetical protein